MASRTRHLQNAHTTRIVGQLTLAWLVTSCGLLENVKELPQPAESAVLSNAPGVDAGDAAVEVNAEVEIDASPPDVVARTSTASDVSTSGATSTEQHSTGVPEAATADPSTSALTTSGQASAHFEPDAGTPIQVDASPAQMVDSGNTPESLVDTDSIVVWDSGADSGGVPITKCGIPQTKGVPLCDPVAQCGCETGDNCAYTPTRARRFTCVAPGTTPVQDACDLDDQCALGNVCHNGLCMATCATNEECGEDAQCVDVLTADGVEPDIRVCSKPCDPLDSESCGQGAMCAATSGAYPTCVRKRGEDGRNEDPCEGDADCEHGFGCTEDAVCRAWCTLEIPEGAEAGSQPSECPAHSTCDPAANAFGLGQCSKPCPVPTVEGSECSILPVSCGCSADQTCHIEEWGKTICEAPGPNGYMTWCDKNSQCGVGFSCLANLCRPVCDDTAPCADGSSCIKTLSSDSSPSACLGHCDPLAPESSTGDFTACGTGAYCSPGFSTDSNSPESHCLRGTDARPGVAGEACGNDTDCENGLGCDLGTQTCAAWCTSDQDCEQSSSCYLAGSTRTRNTGELVGWCH